MSLLYDKSVMKRPSKRKKNWKKYAWTVFSKYIRLRDCLKTAGVPNEGLCYTCGKLYSFSQLQAGHFIPGRHNSNLLDPRGVNAQCYHCNVGLKGNPINYWLYMERDHGREIIDELIAQNRETRIMKSKDWEEEYHFWKKELDDLLPGYST